MKGSSNSGGGGCGGGINKNDKLKSSINKSSNPNVVIDDHEDDEHCHDHIVEECVEVETGQVVLELFYWPNPRSTVDSSLTRKKSKKATKSST